MNFFYIIAIICILIYLVSVFRKSYNYKKMNPEDSITLNYDNWGVRNICGTMLFLMLILSGLAFGTLFRTGEIISTESLKIIAMLIFFIIIYISLSAKTKISSVGIYRNSSLIIWSDINKINLPQGQLPSKFKVRIVYKNKITNESIIDINFKNNNEYEDFLFLLSKYSKFKVKNNKLGKNKNDNKNNLDNKMIDDSDNNKKGNKKKKGSK